MTVEFDGVLRDGRIEVPAELAKQFSEHVHVVLSDSTVISNGTTLIDELLDQPLSVPGFQPMTRDEVHGR